MDRYDHEHLSDTDGELQQTGTHNAGLCLHEVTQHEDGTVQLLQVLQQLPLRFLRTH